MKKIVSTLGILLVLALCFITLYDFNSKNENLTKVKVAEVIHSIFYAPQYVTISERYFEEVRIDIDLTLASDTDKVMAAVLSKDGKFLVSRKNIYIIFHNSLTKIYKFLAT